MANKTETQPNTNAVASGAKANAEEIKLPANFNLKTAAQYHDDPRYFFTEVAYAVGAGNPDAFPPMRENGIDIRGLQLSAEAGSSEARAALVKLQTLLQNAQKS